jgi:hypothetical protein
LTVLLASGFLIFLVGPIARPLFTVSTVPHPPDSKAAITSSKSPSRSIKANFFSMPNSDFSF